MDFLAVATLPRTSHKPTSVSTRKSAKAETCQEAINPKHLSEWVEGSGIDEELARMNLQSLSGDTVFKLLRPLGGRDEAKDRPRMAEVLRSGWFCRTLSLGRKESTKPWGCFKPDHPRPGFKKDPETGRYFPKLDDSDTSVNASPRTTVYWLHIRSGKTTPNGIRSPAPLKIVGVGSSAKASLCSSLKARRKQRRCLLLVIWRSGCLVFGTAAKRTKKGDHTSSRVYAS